jgi:DNA topoisomerase-2
LKNLKTRKSLKVAALTGYMIAEAKYHHGDSSANDAITTMGQSFKFALPYFDGIGEFGSLYSPTAGAARYIEIKLSSAFDLLFKDNNLLVHNTDDGEDIEPIHYLPIIPTALVNATSGIAVGYASDSTNRNPLQIIDEMINYLTTGNLDMKKKLQPYCPEAIGRWVRYNGTFEHHGLMEITNSTTVKITGIPYNQTFDSYEATLNRLLEENYAEEWYDESDGGAINYVIKFKREQLKKHIAEDTLYHRLKMYARIPQDNYTLIDIDGKIVRFENEMHIIKRFTDWRSTIYDVRKATYIDKLERDIKKYSDRMKFIKLVNDGTIVIKDIKNREEGRAILEHHELPEEMLDIKLYSISKDEASKLAAKIKTIQAELTAYRKIKPVDMYVEDLTLLREVLVKNGMSINDIEIIETQDYIDQQKTA